MTNGTREMACRLAAQVCQGHMPTGSTLLSYIILFESFMECGGDETAQAMGWDVTERPPVQLSVIRANLAEELS